MPAPSTGGMGRIVTDAREWDVKIGYEGVTAISWFRRTIPYAVVKEHPNKCNEYPTESHHIPAYCSEIAFFEKKMGERTFSETRVHG